MINESSAGPMLTPTSIITQLGSGVFFFVPCLGRSTLMLHGNGPPSNVSSRNDISSSPLHPRIVTPAVN
ncbi:hypothetical protein Y032_0002g650 [Ancylostoma ceylanicum]|uniref:Uncharacterized protein n=1 Tax=Ancylostoma ceylanicum TaxID=53326 RepID=A0A016W2H0_9BILA|nr:hypothetical protein Y032_0002g650 [Ancylostoma ceylanicum]